MIFQKVLKGITIEDEMHARLILEDSGIVCNLWRKVGAPLTPKEVRERLTDRNVEWHLNHYDDKDDKENNEIFSCHTPFISTTAGCVERDARSGKNPAFSALITAVKFATANFTRTGWVFYGYVNVIGRKSVPLAEFAEETRELHIWTDFQQWHPEGEVMAKIVIPPTHLERAECYDGPTLVNRGKIVCIKSLRNAYYKAPESFSNVREVTVP
jgi:hypothetical protein